MPYINVSTSAKIEDKKITWKNLNFDFIVNSEIKKDCNGKIR